MEILISKNDGFNDISSKEEKVRLSYLGNRKYVKKVSGDVNPLRI